MQGIGRKGVEEREGGERRKRGGRKMENGTESKGCMWKWKSERRGMKDEMER